MVNNKLMQLRKAGVHFGHKANCLNPKMIPYIFAEKNGRHILDLIQTSFLLNQACIFVKMAAQQKKNILFIGTSSKISKIVAQEAKKCNAFYINQRWLGGLLTNWKTVKTRIERLKLLEQQEQNGNFNILPKKEAAIIKKELKKLKNYFNGVKDMKNIPDILIVINQQQELTAIKESINLNIPIISIIDSNCDPDLVTFPIPGNNDSILSVKLILSELSKNILDGRLEK
jgi:small subunit ribosomal protein S2